MTGSPTPADVISDLTAAGCTPESLAIIVDSVFNIYIPGAPAAVNAGFPATLPAGGFFARCL